MAASIVYPTRNDPAVWDITWTVTLIVSALGLSALPAVFGGLQVAGDGRTPGLTRSAVIEDHASAEPNRRGWILLVVRKELRLQSLTLAISGLYVLWCVAVAFTRRGNPQYSGPTFEALSNLHALLIPIIAGAFASAEERQLGTLMSQLLAPKATWKSWTIKVSVAIALTFGLGYGLPLLMGWVAPQPDRFRIHAELMIASVALLSVSTWVSSLSTSGLWALLATLPLLAAAAFAGHFLFDPFQHALRAFPENPALITRRGIQLVQPLVYDVSVVLALGLPGLMFSFAGRNHRSMDRSWRGAGTQVLLALTYCLLAVLILSATSSIAWNTLGRR
jgi:hypothetical protein